jgi:hypothetical protein
MGRSFIFSAIAKCVAHLKSAALDKDQIRPYLLSSVFRTGHAYHENQ